MLVVVQKVEEPLALLALVVLLRYGYHVPEDYSF
jgi:hypothetical protein